MRFCFCNPHVCSGINLLSFILVRDKRKLTRNDKYLYLLSILKDKKYHTAIFVDGTATSLSGGSSLLKFISENHFIIRVVSFFEIYAWCFINGINPLNINIIFRKKKLNPARDILFGFAFLPDTFLSEKMVKKSIFFTFPGKKILHATHFFSRTQRVAENIKLTSVRLMVAEADLKESLYFNKYFYFIDKVLLLPFVIREKYKKINPFRERKNLCLALGTLLEYNTTGEEFEDVWKNHYDFFQLNNLQPMRRIIYENSDKIRGVICSHIEPQKKKMDAKSDYLKAYQKWRIYRLLSSFFINKESGKRYHDIDIVEEYNKYQMFVSPEENIGLPSVNFIEGMACGCAYIGLDHPMYNDMGLIDGVNYVAYDGTLEGLKVKVGYYQVHIEELEKIAKNGCEFVMKNFNKKTVVENFWKKLSDTLKGCD